MPKVDDPKAMASRSIKQLDLIPADQEQLDRL